MIFRLLVSAALVLLPLAGAAAAETAWYPVPEDSHPHDVAPAPDGSDPFANLNTPDDLQAYPLA